MHAEETVHFCLECGKKLVGRSDKKFCDTNCRVTYNNRLMSDEVRLTRGINRILLRNRRIMAKYVPNGKEEVHKSELLIEGFNFEYVTHLIESETGNKVKCCYDYGYIEMSVDKILLIRFSKHV